MLLSIGMMVKNEEKHLEECLQSLAPLLNNIEAELIIIDTGSTDNSVEIAKRFTNKIFFHPWNDNFSEMRNMVIGYCTGEWVMVIDGDEVLQNPAAIINFINSGDREKYNTALLIVKNLTDEKDLSSFSMLSSPRLFRRDKDFHYEGIVHNQPVFKSPIVKLDSNLIHYGYISTDKELMERKFERTSHLLKKELEKEPTNFYYWCQLSASYAMHYEYEKAVNYAEKAYEVLKNSGLNSGEYIYVYTQLAYSCLMNKEYKKTIEICLEGNALKSGVLDLYFYLAKAQMAMKEYESAVKSYKEYLNIGKNIQKFSDTNVSLYTLGKYEYAYYDLVIALTEIEDYKSAFEYCKRITDPKLLAISLPNTIFLCLKTKCYDYLHLYYDRYASRLNLQGEFEQAIESCRKGLSVEDRFEIGIALKDIDGLYGMLNNVRCSIFKNEKLSLEINIYLESNIGFNTLPDYYGDFLYYLILHNGSLCKALGNVRELDINRFFVYLNGKYDDLGEKIFSYLQEVNFNEGNFQYRVKKALERYCILTARLNDEDYVRIFNVYIEDGTSYIKKIYSEDIIINENIYELKNEEEGFLLYMSKAISVKNSDKKSYIGYLRKALKVYPYMQRGIEYLLDEFNDEQRASDNELEQYKIQVKSKIKALIEGNELKAAKAVISEYEKIVKDDIEILLFKSQIALKENSSVNEIKNIN